VTSPSSRITATIAASPGGALTYSVSIRGQRVLAPSALGIVVDGQNLGQNAIVGRPTTRVLRETYLTRGAHTMALNHYREAIFPVASGAARTPWQLEVRAFNDGVAFRYRVPGAGARRINGEVSAWKLPPESVIWFQTNTTEYERPFVEQQSDSLAVGTVVGAPITAKLPNGLLCRAYRGQPGQLQRHGAAG
jgi:alpha-glucosidase